MNTQIKNILVRVEYHGQVWFEVVSIGSYYDHQKIRTISKFGEDRRYLKQDGTWRLSSGHS